MEQSPGCSAAATRGKRVGPAGRSRDCRERHRRPPVQVGNQLGDMLYLYITLYNSRSSIIFAGSFCTTKASDSSQQVLAAQFLHSILFNDATGATPPLSSQKQQQQNHHRLPVLGTPGVVGANFTVQSRSAAQQMLGLLTLTQV